MLGKISNIRQLWESFTKKKPLVPGPQKGEGAEELPVGQDHETREKSDYSSRKQLEESPVYNADGTKDTQRNNGDHPNIDEYS